MNIPTITCRCGTQFTPTKEEMDLHVEGFAPLPEQCDECFQMSEQAPEPDGPSDADPGL